MRSGVFELPRTLPLQGLLSLPERADNAAPCALLVFLHGHDEGAPAELRAAMTRHGPLRPGSARVARSDFIVMAPQLPVQGDVWGRYAAEVDQLCDYAREQLRADARRAYLSGFSFGGNGVFDLALHEPDRWAALWAVDPTRVPPADPGLPIWLSLGQLSRGEAGVFARRLKLAHSGFGDSDRVYHDDGLDHVGAATAAYRDAEVYRWLLKHRHVGMGHRAPAHAAHTDIL